MNREIEFRGKRLDNGEWVYGCLTRYSEAMAYITVDLVENEVYKVDMETVGQYTGSEDKKGVKAYEGDVVKCTESFPDELEFISRIFWGGSGFLVKKGTIYYPIDIYDSNPRRVSFNKMEIIGNIYDNIVLRLFF